MKAAIQKYTETAKPYEKLKIVKPDTGNHRYARSQVMYQAIHRFVSEMKWRRSAEADGGTT